MSRDLRAGSRAGRLQRELKPADTIRRGAHDEIDQWERNHLFVWL